MKHLRFLFVLNSLFLLVIGLSACAETAQPMIEPTVVVSPHVAATLTPKVAPSVTVAAQPASAISLEDCTIGTVLARCGTYRVYENRSARSGRQIDLKIAVLPATGSASTRDRIEPDPLFYFTGGPGGAATNVAPMLKTEFSELNKTRDIVLIDQRGTGGSNLLMCPKPDKPFDVTDAAALSAYAEFEPVGTVPSFQKRGLGSALLAYAHNRLREMGCPLATVQSWSTSEGANKLYQGAGLLPKDQQLNWVKA